MRGLKLQDRKKDGPKKIKGRKIMTDQTAEVENEGPETSVVTTKSAVINPRELVQFQLAAATVQQHK